ncbi:MAG TPA: Rrf2 family transcriptional regulator [Microlunatus sp.]|nr:Rrf2 family transcriptional regulator [Microlunatus sp.]
MHITARVDYALQTMVALAESEHTPVPAIEIAERLDLSYTYLLTIVGELRRAGFITMRRGPAGGLQLAKPAQSITLGEIVTAIDGPLTLADGTQPETAADHAADGLLPSLWATAHQAMMDVLSQVRLSEARSTRAADPA